MCDDGLIKPGPWLWWILFTTGKWWQEFCIWKKWD
jgi:hypothetical protein